MSGRPRPRRARPGRAPLCALLLAVALLPVIAGCGGHSRTTSTTTTASGTGGTSSQHSRVTSPQVIEGHAFARFPPAAPPARAELPAPPATRTVEADYLRALFNDAQSFWRREFRAARLRYVGARVTVFSGKVSTNCGDGSGLFYCPPDGVYLDLGYFEGLLRNRGKGAAAQAYIVGHEIAHHIQRLVGLARRVDAANEADPSGRNARSVQIELQADCLAGVWASSAFPRSRLTDADLQEGLRTADLLGDDYEARATGAAIEPALFTHGSSTQRQRWLSTGFTKGRPAACNTFAAG